MARFGRQNNPPGLANKPSEPPLSPVTFLSCNCSDPAYYRAAFAKGARAGIAQW